MNAMRAVPWVALPLLAACGGNPGAPNPVPISLPAESLVALISAGSDHTCGVTTRGKAFCWGANSFGQLGDAATERSATPVAVRQAGLAAAPGFSAITAGDRHTCAAQGLALFCWGENSQGQLGNATFESSTTPVIVKNPQNQDGLNSNFLSAGPTGSHTCSVDVLGDNIYCWGSNRFGQLGTDAVPASSIPLKVARPPDAYPYADWSAIVAGATHTCILLEDGHAWCWGDNSAGQLGRTGIAASATPLAVAGSAFVKMTAGGEHTCGTTGVPFTPSTTWCWGSNSDGQLGNGTTIASAAPVAIANHAFEQISAGARHTCGITSQRQLFCWGSNSRGQLGNGSTASSAVPVPVSLPNMIDVGFVAVTAGKEHTCAIGVRGKAYCWGSNASGQLGNGTATDSIVPVAVADLS
jgi:alpha-tubulin suppressor-like RCC1 family protein